MSNQNESLPEAPSAQHPRPAQTLAVQEEEMEQEATVATSAVTEASAAAAEDEGDTDQKLLPHPSIFDAGNNKMPIASSVSGDRMHVDFSQASSGERVTGGITKDPRPATVPRTKKPGTMLAGVASTAASSRERVKGGVKKDPRPATGGTSSLDQAASWIRRKDPRPVPSPTPDIPEPSDDDPTSYERSTDEPAASWIRRKDPRPIRRPKAISADSTGAADGQRRKDPRPAGLSHGVASRGTAAARERQDSWPPTEPSSSGAASIEQAASWIRRKDPRPVPRLTPDIPELSDDEPTSYQHSTDEPASHATPGAVAVPGINSNDNAIENADPEPEQPGQAQDIALNVEATANSQHATLQATIGAYVVNEGGQEAETTRNTRADELLMEHMFAGAPLVSGDAVQNLSAIRDADVTSHKCSPREYSRRSWAMLASLMAIIVAAATLMGVLIPQGSTVASQEGIQESQSSTAPSFNPTRTPSLLQSFTPTFDPDTLRLNSIQSILVPISGLEVLLDTATPQYHALDWVSHVDPLRLPYNTEAERKRVVQRYVLAVLYYACGGQHWHNSAHFLGGIHECHWWGYKEMFTDAVFPLGALCTKGEEAGVVDYLGMDSNNFTGTLPAELQHLTGLKELEISQNKNLGGPIPEFNGNMTSLTRLSLEGNMHTGTIPSSLGRLSNLEELWLDINGLMGTIPESFGNLTSLQYLGFSDNMLNGTIPSVLGQLSSLESLWLYGGNRLMGTIPESFGNLTSLQSLSLSSNMLNGTIPSVLGQLSGLKSLGLNGNSLTGTIPESFGNLTGLQSLWLFSNMLNGTIPSVLGQLSGLISLRLNDNSLTGEIPYEICRRAESGNITLSVDTLTANGTEFLCECIPVEGLSGCCVIRPNDVGDGSCEDDEPYNTAACGWDGGDCLVEGLPECLGIDPSWIGDGYCDLNEPYNTKACGYDGGDCCESTCKGSDCGENGYNCKDPTINVTCLDADGLEGCCVEHPSQIGDGYCHPYEPYYTEACKYDNGDCPTACPEGTFPPAGKNSKNMSECCRRYPQFIGDGWCDFHDEYNTAACGWDGGDCCEETCEFSYYDCGGNGYDCKDPTISNR